MNRIKKGDKVMVVSGKDRGKTGVVKKIEDERVVVDGLNIVKKHVKPNPQIGVPGGIVELESSIHASNVALLDEKTGKKTKVGYKLENGKKIRFNKALA